MDDVQNYTCECAQGFIGRHCEIGKNQSRTQSDVCARARLMRADALLRLLLANANLLDLETLIVRDVKNSFILAR